GHKLTGTLGLHAGDVSEPGSGVQAQVVDYRADMLRDRNGDRLSLAVDLEALAATTGVGATFQLGATHLTTSVGVPFARTQADTTRSETGLVQFGLGDLYLQPVKLGWRSSRFGVVTSYGFYVPIGRYAPGPALDLGQGQWTHQFGVGGNVAFDPARR